MNALSTKIITLLALNEVKGKLLATASYLRNKGGETTKKLLFAGKELHMADIDDISSRLIETLQERGCEITKENGAANVIVIAIAEAYNLGIEKGIRSGKIEMIELMDMKISSVKKEIIEIV